MAEQRRLWPPLPWRAAQQPGSESPDSMSERLSVPGANPRPSPERRHRRPSDPGRSADRRAPPGTLRARRCRHSAQAQLWFHPGRHRWNQREPCGRRRYRGRRWMRPGRSRAPSRSRRRHSHRRRRRSYCRWDHRARPRRRPRNRRCPKLGTWRCVGRSSRRGYWLAIRRSPGDHSGRRYGPGSWGSDDRLRFGSREGLTKRTRRGQIGRHRLAHRCLMAHRSARHLDTRFGSHRRSTPPAARGRPNGGVRGVGPGAARRLSRAGAIRRPSTIAPCASGPETAVAPSRPPHRPTTAPRRRPPPSRGRRGG